MRFSWKALVIAPLAVPVLTGAVLALGVEQKAADAFFFFTALTSVFSYAATAGLLAPAVFVAARFTRMTAWRTGLIGLGLGAILCVPICWIMYKSSGPDSGPPTETYAEWLMRWGVGWCWPFIVGGAANGLLYGWLASRPKTTAPVAAN